MFPRIKEYRQETARLTGEASIGPAVPPSQRKPSCHHRADPRSRSRCRQRVRVGVRHALFRARLGDFQSAGGVGVDGNGSATPLVLPTNPKVSPTPSSNRSAFTLDDTFMVSRSEGRRKHAYPKIGLPLSVLSAVVTASALPSCTQDSGLNIGVARPAAIRECSRLGREIFRLHMG